MLKGNNVIVGLLLDLIDCGLSDDISAIAISGDVIKNVLEVFEQKFRKVNEKT